MLLKLRSYVAIFFLLSFLFPSAVKEVHAAFHEDAIDCKANAQQHFHEHHEECHFCDVVLPFASEPSKAQHNFSSHPFAEYIFPNLVEVFFSTSSFSSTQLRAPPAC